jgi:hypothetical protein
MNKTQAIEKVNGMLPSLVLFTQEQVLEIINEIKSEQNTLTRDLVEKIIIEYNDILFPAIRRDIVFEDVVDHNTAVFELYGNEITISEVAVDERKVVDYITDNLNFDGLINKIVDKFCPENNESNEDN